MIIDATSIFSVFCIDVPFISIGSRILQGSDSMTQFPPWRAGHLMMRPYVDPLMNLLEGGSALTHGTTGRDPRKHLGETLGETFTNIRE